MDNRGLLAVIAVLLFGIVTILMIQMGGGPANAVDGPGSYSAFTMADRN